MSRPASGVVWLAQVTTRTPRAAPTRPSRPQSRAGHSRVRTTAIRPTAAGAGTRYRSLPVLHRQSRRFVHRSCFPFPAGFRHPRGFPALSLGNRGTGPPDRSQGAPGPGESPPEPPAPRPFSTSTPRAAPCGHPRGPVQSSPRPAGRDDTRRTRATASSRPRRARSGAAAAPSAPVWRNHQANRVRSSRNFLATSDELIRGVLAGLVGDRPSRRLPLVGPRRFTGPHTVCQ